MAFHCAYLLGACFFASPPFYGARSVICQQRPCCQHVVMVCCLFCNFAEPFDFGCCSLAQDMSFQAVAYHPPVGLPAFPPICSLIVCAEISSLCLPPSLVYFQHSHLFCSVLVFSLFIAQFWGFFVWESVSPGGYAGLSQGWLGEYLMMLGADLFGLPNVSQVGSPPVFSV
jgi:hypothetical protein